MSAPLTLADRVAETAVNVTNVSPMPLGGAVDARHDSFVGALGVTGALVPYVIVHRTSGQWEYGYGVLATGPDTITRAVVKRNSAHTTSLINFSAGTVDVFLDIGAEDLPVLDADDRGIGFIDYNAAPSFEHTLFGARGTKAAPTAIQSGDTLGRYGFGGYGATAFSNRAKAAMRGSAAENWTDAAQGADLVWATTPKTTTTATDRMWLSSEGALAIGAIYGSGGASQPLQVHATVGPLWLMRSSNNTAGSNLSIVKSRGATAGSLAALVAGDAISILNFLGVAGDGSTVASAAQISVDIPASGVATTTIAGQITFLTTNLAGSQAIRLKVSSEGVITPGADNTYALGTGALQWSDFRTVLASFTGLVTATAGIATSATAAATGVLRLGNNQSIKARNAGNSADLVLIFADASDNTNVGGGNAVLIGGAAAMSSTLNVTGITTVGAGVVIGVGTFAAGKIYTEATGGLTVIAKAGATYDYILYNPGGSYVGGIMSVPTGTGNVSFPNGNMGIGAAATGRFGLNLSGTATAAVSAIGFLLATTLVATANSDTLIGAYIGQAFTPGSFTGIATEAMRINAFSVAGFTSPGDPKGLNIQTITATGAANSYAIRISPPVGATTNYLISDTGNLFNVLTSGVVSLGAVAGFASTNATLQTSDVGVVSVQHARFGADGTGIQFVARKSRGTTAGSLAAVVAGDTLFQMIFSGVAGDNSTHSTAAGYLVNVASGGVATTKVSGEHQWTTTNLAGTGAVRLWLTSEGVLKPFVDNTYALGTGSLRWSDFQAVTGTFGGTATFAAAGPSSLVLGVDGSVSGGMKIWNASAASREGNIYGDATYSIRLDTNSNARPIRIDGSALSISSAVTMLSTLNVTGAAIVQPSLFVGGGTGSAPGVATSGVQAWYSSNQSFVTFILAGNSANARIAEFQYVGTTMRGRFVNDAYGAATNWIVVTGTSASITSIDMTGGTIGLSGTTTVTGALTTTSTLTLNNGILQSASSTDILIASNNSGATSLVLRANGTNAIVISGTQVVTMPHYGAGAATFDASGNISSVSDERHKTDITFFTRGLRDLRGIKPITHRYNKASGLEMEHYYTGFLAQNVREWIPEAVFEDQRSGILSFADRPVLAAVVNGLLELEDRVATLEARN